MGWEYKRVTYEYYLANPSEGIYTFDYTDIEQEGRTDIKIISTDTDIVYSDSFNIYENEVARDIYLEKINDTTFLTQRRNQTPTGIKIYEYDIALNKLNIVDFAEVKEVSSFANRVIGQNTFAVYEYTKLNTGLTSIKPITLKQGLPENVIGFAEKTATSGEELYVKNGYEIEGFENLTKGAIYYLDDNGGLSITEKTVADKIGVALSDTKIKLFKQNRGI